MSRSKEMESLRAYNTHRIVNSEFKPIPLNVKLTSNPFLKDQEKFHYLVYKLNDYNKRIIANTVTDPYESMSFERLHSVVCDLASIFTKDDQITRLEESFHWWKDQERMIEQRMDQGYVRYEVNKEVRHGVSEEKKQPVLSQKSHENQIPSETLARETKPFRRGWRTTHKELDIPLRRLNQYKRKFGNFSPVIDPQQEKKAPRVLYPKIEKIQQPKEEEPQENQQQQQIVVEGQVPEQEKKPQEDANQQQDLGFGEEPEEPEEQQKQQEEESDKLAPRFKSYTVQFGDIKRKQYKEAYLFYQGEEVNTERRMEERYLKLKHEELQKQKQDDLFINQNNIRGAHKSKMEKQLQKRLQNMKFRPKYSFSQEQPSYTERLNPQDELKFGFTMSNINKERERKEIGLPGLANPRQTMYEKSIRRDRLKSLKNKFGKMLNLAEYEQRDTSASICQATSRKRGLSQIIRNHNKETEILSQLDEVVRIKEKLAQSKANVDVRSLSMGLCAPQDEDFKGENMFPNKVLPSNPAMVDNKKKKKKKK